MPILPFCKVGDNYNLGVLGSGGCKSNYITGLGVTVTLDVHIFVYWVGCNFGYNLGVLGGQVGGMARL